MIKAVIYDMDGLLIDSEPLWEEIEYKIFRDMLGVPITKENHTLTRGMRVNEIVAFWHNFHPWHSHSLQEIETLVVEEVVRAVNEKGQALPGVAENITLFKRLKIPVAIASSSYMSIIDAVMDKLNLRPHINVIHSAEHEKYGKPHPAVFLTAAEKLGVKPENCLVFEDAPNGVLAAKAAKMRCVAVPNEDVRRDKRFIIADLVLNSLSEFTEEMLNTL